MPGTPLERGLAAVALVGAAVSAYLLAAGTGDAPLVCATGGGCETVQSSEYAEIAGVSVALLGVLAWSALLATAFLRSEAARMAGAAIAVAGAAFSVYLVGVQVFAIEALCSWCLVSDTLMVVAAGLAVWRLR
jgi:uncharacterized membrane protein